MVRFFCLLCSLVLTSTSSFATGALTPHRAVYEITFKDASPESQLTGALGKWVVEVNGGACVGYSINYRFVTQLRYGNGRTDILDTRGASFEAGDGDSFNFTNKTFHNNNVIEDVRGVASRADDEVTIKLSKPETFDGSVDQKVLFPSQHFLKIIADAKNNRRFVENIVYEGVEGAKEAFAVSTTIGSERGKPTAVDDVPYKDLENGKLRSWPVTLAYFKTDTRQESLPEWQNRFILYENGISRDFVFDYGHFALKAKMEQLELLKPEDCS